jgi:hypothetical protein
MRGFSAAALALVALATQNAAAFTPANFRQVSERRSMSITVATSATDKDVDVSIPYEAISVSNVSAKKKAREEGGVVPAMLALNEYGDYTFDEYEKVMGGGSSDGSSEPKSTGDVLGKAMKAAESAAAASSALQDAADALSEDEEVGFI